MKLARRWLDSGRVSKKADRICAQIECGVREKEGMVGDGGLGNFLKTRVSVTEQETVGVSVRETGAWLQICAV